MLFNFIGPDNGQGLQIFHDGVEVGRHTMRTISFLFRIIYQLPQGDGRIVIGTPNFVAFSSLQIDELVIFEEHLTCRCDKSTMLMNV